MNKSISLAYHTITWRDDIVAALRDISHAGFQGFEAFSFPPKPDDTWYGYVDRLAQACAEQPETYLETENYRTPMELAGLAAKQGLRLSSMYCSGRFIDPDLVEHEIRASLSAARFVKSAGCGHLILGGGLNTDGVYTRNDYDRFFHALHEIGSQCREIGIRACYHPHSGTMVETGEQVDLFCRETDPALIALTPDVAHLTRGGADPVETIYRYADRIKYIHLKDIRDGEFVELGEGTIDLQGVMKAIDEIGYSGWLVVELDDTTRTPLESAQISHRFLEDHLSEK
ncbi:MAG: sugar phosphate isomerase/epimerase [Gemmatimonadota bacterium]|nr:sugar phosphate isomerase/epimerase [Gemmatimonadota bacterium]